MKKDYQKPECEVVELLSNGCTLNTGTTETEETPPVEPGIPD